VQPLGRHGRLDEQHEVALEQRVDRRRQSAHAEGAHRVGVFEHLQSEVLERALLPAAAVGHAQARSRGLVDLDHAARVQARARADGQLDGIRTEVRLVDVDVQLELLVRTCRGKRFGELRVLLLPERGHAQPAHERQVRDRVEGLGRERQLDAVGGMEAEHARARGFQLGQALLGDASGEHREGVRARCRTVVGRREVDRGDERGIQALVRGREVRAGCEAQEVRVAAGGLDLHVACGSRAPARLDRLRGPVVEFGARLDRRSVGELESRGGARAAGDRRRAGNRRRMDAGAPDGRLQGCGGKRLRQERERDEVQEGGGKHG
jgi:hypothetical protein